MRSVYITRFSKFLPNEVVNVEQIEEILGMIGGVPSKAKRIVLRSNGIKNRFYALDKEGRITHSNAEMVALAVKGLLDAEFGLNEVELLCCGTSSPDQPMPSHGVMVHGHLGTRPMEVATFSGNCCSGMQALKYGYMSVMTGMSENAVCSGSELTSPYMLARNFNTEVRSLEELEQRPILAFEKEFLRWMLSDGAGAVLLQNKPGEGLSLKIDWMDSVSFANEAETCMYAGAVKDEDGQLKSWLNFHPDEWNKKSIFSMKQDVRILEKNIVRFGALKLADLVKKYNIDLSEVDFFLPHLSSEYFRQKIHDELIPLGIDIPQEKWYTNLAEVGNIGAGSIYVMLESLFQKNMLKSGNKILVMVPESARFSYVYAYFTVV